jgi:signal peptidase I
LWPGDFVFADMRYACVACRQPVRRGDVAVFAYPNDRTLLYVKRVVALPGDRVQLGGDGVRVNGAAVVEVAASAPPFAAAPQPVVPPPVSAAPLDFIVPAGQVFALGDHRSASVDSRHFGTVPLQDVVGRVRQIWFSWGEGGVRWARLGQVVE